VEKEEFHLADLAINLAIDRILEKGSDDVFKPPVFSLSVESSILSKNADAFRKVAYGKALDFLKAADLTRERIGPARRGLVAKDKNSFRQCAWLDPFDAVKYLAVSYMLFHEIEAARIPKHERIVHSHRLSEKSDEIFDQNFGYDSFRQRSSELSRDRIGKWKVVTDISNFFDRISNHSLENHLLDLGCNKKYVSLVREMLYFWAGDRRSYGIPVGSDASRILSEAVLLDVDAKLKNYGIVFVRYVDDFRIFSETKAEALKAIEILTNLLADEGLSLNNRKTDIFKIVDAEEISQFTNKLSEGEHQGIDLEEKIEVKRAIRVSGKSSISRFYREPGKEALEKIKKISKDEIINGFINSSDFDIEQQIKLVVKYFVYVDQDVDLLKILIDKKITSIFYIADALIKEVKKFDQEKREAIKKTIFDSVEWLECAYPLQIPILRIAGHPLFMEPGFVHGVIDRHLYTDNIIFFREAITLGAHCLDRSRLRTLAMNVFENVPDFVRRQIYFLVNSSEILSESERRPLLRNMKQHIDDWFIGQI